MNSVIWASSFFFLSQHFFSTERFLSCSCVLFKLNFTRWLILELFICPKARGRVGQVTVMLPVSLVHACFPSFFCSMVSVVMVLYSYLCFFMFFSLFSFSLKCIAVTSDSNEYLLFDRVKPKMCNNLSAL